MMSRVSLRLRVLSNAGKDARAYNDLPKQPIARIGRAPVTISE
jgi:hypothetical protein